LIITFKIAFTLPQRPQATGLITVRLDVAPEHEAEFNDWYRLEHVPQLTALPGFVRTRRYFCETADLRYLAWYETEDERVEAGPDFQRIVAQPTPWSRRMRKLYGDRRERMNFKLMREVGRTDFGDAPWLYIVHTDIPDSIVDEYNAWHDSEHLPRCAAIPGVLRARRYASTGIVGGTTDGPRYLTAYEMTGPLGKPRRARGAQDAVDRKNARPVLQHPARALPAHRAWNKPPPGAVTQAPMNFGGLFSAKAASPSA
jgi:hypothetical protein